MGNDERQIEKSDDERSSGKATSRQGVGDRSAADYGSKRRRRCRQHGEGECPAKLGVGDELRNAGRSPRADETNERRGQEDQEDRRKESADDRRRRREGAMPSTRVAGRAI